MTSSSQLAHVRTSFETATDAELVERYVAGEDRAFLEILHRYRSMVYNLAYKITGNREDAEDATQDAFLNLARKLDRFQGRSALKTWIYRVAVNSALMLVRGSKKHQHQDLDVTGADTDDGHVAHVAPDWSKVPDAVFLSEEGHGVIRRAIQKLPEKFRPVLVLADVEGLPNKDIGELLGLSLPAVKSRLHRARLFLRKELALYFDRRVTDDGKLAPATKRPLAHVA